MLDRLFFITLVLNAIGLFRFVAPQFGTKIGMVSIALLVLHGVYLPTRHRDYAPLLPLLRGTGLKNKARIE